MNDDSGQLAGDIRWVDAHCHVDLFPDPRSIIRWADKEQVAILAVTNAPSVFTEMTKLASASKYVLPAIGLHPELAAERSSEIEMFRTLQRQTRFIGEIGLDGNPRIRHTLGIQRQVFESILQASREAGGKVLSVHSRHAMRDVIAAIGTRSPGSVILHWFTGSLAVAEKAVASGCYFSINQQMCSSRGFRSLLRLLPKDRVLTESDGPLARTNGKPAHPGDVKAVVSMLASSWDKTVDDAQKLIADNFRNCCDNPVTKGR